MAIIRPQTKGKEQTPQRGQGAIPSSAQVEQHQQQVIIQTRDPNVLIPSPWTTGLFGCFEDITNCLITVVCPCVTFGQIAEISSRGTTTCCCAGCIYCLLLAFLGCPCLYSCFYSCCFRAKLRMMFTLPEEPCADCFVHTFCEYCALCQEYRELKNRGVYPNAGWQAYAQKIKENQGVPMMSPIIAQSMMR